MLEITARTSVGKTVEYFDTALSTPDYYTERGQITGQWHGINSETLGATGEVSREQFKDLISNINPTTGEKLTARNSNNRRCAYELVFSSPKSVSIAYGVTGNENIREAFQDAYRKTMTHIEEHVETRVRQNGQNTDRVTGNFIYADFVHTTTRPLDDGIPDPHLHAHCIVPNATYDQVEEKWKAIEIGTIKSDGQYYDAYFNNAYAENLAKLGFQIERNDRDFEIAGISRETIERYSRRTNEIEAVAEKRGIKAAKAKAQLGMMTRNRKQEKLTPEELTTLWKGRLRDQEGKPLDPNNDGGLKEKTTAKETIDFALDHALSRKSAVDEKELLTLAFRRGSGTVTTTQIRAELESRNLIKKKKGKQTFYTTQEAVDEEQYLIKITRQNKGKYAPINKGYKPPSEAGLSDEQASAVKKVLSSRDLVTVIAGGAGTGKTRSIREVANGARKAGRRFHAFAPSAAASRGVQREEGFQNATTIAALLQSQTRQRSVKDGIIWIDEAGMVGNKTMNQILLIAKQQNARVLLTGDVNQHNSVERGDSLRIMQEKAKVRVARITKVRRQQKADYKSAVELLSSGRMIEGFDALDKMDAIKESTDHKSMIASAANEYVTARKENEDVLLVATTHAQGRELTIQIRDDLKTAGLLGSEDREFTTTKDLGFTDAKKGDAASFTPGQIITFNLPAKGGFKRGASYTVSEKKNSTVKVTDKDGFERPLLLEQADRFSVGEAQTTQLAKGDIIRITRNSQDMKKKRLNGNDVLTVKGFTKEGHIIASKAKTEIVLDKTFTHFTHGYYTTSPSSQGKSVNRVIVTQGKASGKAANKEQFYVSSSRGKFAISVHTDSKDSMLRNIQRSSQRLTASEIAERSLNDRLVEKFGAIRQIFRTASSKMKNAAQSRNLTSIIFSSSVQPKKYAAPTRTR